MRKMNKRTVLPIAFLLYVVVAAAVVMTRPPFVLRVIEEAVAYAKSRIFF